MSATSQRSSPGRRRLRWDSQVGQVGLVSAACGILCCGLQGRPRQADLRTLFAASLLRPHCILAVTLSERGAARLYRLSSICASQRFPFIPRGPWSCGLAKGVSWWTPWCSVCGPRHAKLIARPWGKLSRKSF